jgi:hypothetical protein
VFLHVGTTLVVPTEGDVYEPTDGAVTVPYPPSPGACASANVLVRGKAAANAIVVSLMRVSFFFSPWDNRAVSSLVPYLSVIEAAKPFTSRRASMLQQSSSIECHSG